MAAAALLTALLVVVGCQTERIVPTVASIEGLMTEAYLTEQSPPASLHVVKFERIDAELSRLPAWHHSTSLLFDGTDTETGAAVSGEIAAEVFTNELRGEKRVLLTVKGTAFNSTAEGSAVEGVRIGNDFFVVNQNKICARAADAANRRITELTASALIGGVREARFTYNQREIEARRTWEYAFTPGSVIPPPMELREGSAVTIASGALWIAPSVNAVAEYQITFNVKNVVIQGSRPMSGQLRVRYFLKETGDLFNISIPFGC